MNMCRWGGGGGANIEINRIKEIRDMSLLDYLYSYSQCQKVFFSYSPALIGCILNWLFYGCKTKYCQFINYLIVIDKHFAFYLVKKSLKFSFLKVLSLREASISVFDLKKEGGWGKVNDQIPENVEDSCFNNRNTLISTQITTGKGRYAASLKKIILSNSNKITVVLLLDFVCIK